jgi:DNA segregation ATPase FtsK/SpoIIIE, S-DNA-T family
VADHLRAIWPDGAEAVHSHRLVDSLAAYRPALYGPWIETGKPLTEMSPEAIREARTASSTTLSAALKPLGIRTAQITIRDCCGGAKGVRYADLPALSEGFDVLDEDDDLEL